MGFQEASYGGGLWRQVMEVGFEGCLCLLSVHRCKEVRMAACSRHTYTDCCDYYN